MSDIADRIAERLKAVGLSERAASMQATGSPNTIRNIRVGDSQNPRSDTLHKLAPVLQTSAQWLISGAGEPDAGVAPNASPAPVSLPARHNMPRDIPVMGTAAGAVLGNGSFQITPDVIDWVARPPGLAQSRDVYALYVEGDSMEPQFTAGDLIFVHPHKPVRVHDVVVVQNPDEAAQAVAAYVKIFLRREGAQVVTRQLNPGAEVTFENRPGLVLHKVLTMNELFGL